jgi:hypothetical protein
MSGPNDMMFETSVSNDIPEHKSGSVDRCVGLGTETGGHLARSYLGLAGSSTINNTIAMQAMPRGKTMKNSEDVSPRRRAQLTPRSNADKNSETMLRVSEPRGMWFGLLLNDMGPVSEEDLARVSTHRWNYQGATELARQGRSICFFVWCLLELQRNVQLDEEGDILDRQLVEACKAFVRCQCREGRMGEMYQVLSHFISNSQVFYEWDRFVKVIFEDPRSNQEKFLVTHLEQVWGRYCRLKAVLENIFDYLDSRFVWQHRLPKVGELVRQHMKRRCFSSDLIAKNDLIASPSIRDETLKQVKFAFDFG